MNKALLIGIAGLFAAGCAEMQTYNPQLRSDWDTALYHARQAVDGGNYFAADKVIDEFVRTHPDTREAREIAFWKAAYLLDPANDHGSLPAGIAGLDAYLTANPSGWYRNEATLLRRTAAVAEGIASATRALAAATDSAATATRDTVVVGS